jgi:uncharacterized protein (DUF1697 family)
VTTYIALLRGVNVGGNKQIAMTDLRELAAELGLIDPQTLLQSGNLVFRGPRRGAGGLEQLLETEVRRRLGLDVAFLVRTAADWAKVVARNPFRAEALDDPGHLLVMFLKRAAAARAVRMLEDAIVGRERLRASGAHAYIVYPDGIGRSRLTHAVIEKYLGVHGTGRNWNTVLKLAGLVASAR